MRVGLENGESGQEGRLTPVWSVLVESIVVNSVGLLSLSLCSGHLMRARRLHATWISIATVIFLFL